LEILGAFRANQTPLSKADRLYLEQRLKDLDQNPETTISLEEMEGYFMQKTA